MPDNTIDSTSLENTDLAQTPPTSMSRALSPSVLRLLLTEGKLSATAYEAAIQFLGIRPGPRQWSWFWHTVLSVWGALFIAAGVICFFAYNWADMHYFSKFALIALLIAASGIAAFCFGLDSLPGRLALVIGSLCIGPLLAVYGQVYQTGADAWELFRVWALVVLPLALVGRQAALWLILWLLCSAWGGLYLTTLPAPSYYSLPGLPEFLVGQTVFVIAWEAATFYWRHKPGHAWLEGTWFPRIIFISTLTAVTAELMHLIFTDRKAEYDGYLFLPEGPTCVLLYTIFIVGGWLWFRRKRPDLFMLSCNLFSIATLFVCLLIKAKMYSWDAGSLLLWGLFLAGITAGCGFALRHLQQQMEHEELARNPDMAFKPGFFEKLRSGYSWETLWEHLTQKNLLSEGIPAVPNKSTTPWYIAMQLTFGGWLAALFLMGFLGTFLYMTLGIRTEPEGPLFIGGLIFLGIAWTLLQRETIFLEQFGLAMAMAGTIAVVVAVVLLTKNERSMALVAALTIGAIYPFVRNTAFRYLAAVIGLLLLFGGIDSLIWGEVYSWRYGRSNPDNNAFKTIMYTRQTFTCIWYAVLSMGMVCGWFKENTWRTVPRLNSLLTPLLHGIYCVLLLTVLTTLLGRSFARELRMFVPFSGMVGIGAGVGSIYLAYQFTRHLSMQSPVRWLFIALAVAATAGGWYLPGLTVGLLGLAISRYRGDAVTLGLTAIGLVAYFFYYYYNLHTTLLYKSVVLTVCGTALCAAGFAVYMMMKKNLSAGDTHA